MITPDRVNIRGLDDLSTSDIMTFAAEHYHQYPPRKVEWIDDTSANIVFNDSIIARIALENMTLLSRDIDISSLPLLQSREAKPLSTHPDLRLQIRIAQSTDQKQPRAHEASRFYMMHPEYDPREQRRRNEYKPQQRTSDYRSRRYSDAEQQRRKRMDQEQGINASMYDDNDRSNGTSGQETEEPLSSKNRVHPRQHRSGRQGKIACLDRDRSASPGRQRDEAARRRHRTPPPTYSARDPHPFPSENAGKELFPSKSSTGNVKANKGKELFSNRAVAVGLRKELFSYKGDAIYYHRRSDAFDAAAETADLFANGLNVHSTEKPHPSQDSESRNTLVRNVRLRASDPEPRTSAQETDDVDINILGASKHASRGFLIRGGATSEGTMKELFPGKTSGNQGKELFVEKLKGRGGRRNRAADMFH